MALMPIGTTDNGKFAGQHTLDKVVNICWTANKPPSVLRRGLTSLLFLILFCVFSKQKALADWNQGFILFSIELFLIIICLLNFPIKCCVRCNYGKNFISVSCKVFIEVNFEVIDYVFVITKILCIISSC